MSTQIEDKECINMLAPIDNIFGTHEGRLGPVLKFLIVSAGPFIIYVFALQLFIPFKVMLVVETIWTARMALYILGKEPEKYKRYITAKKDKYQDAYSLNCIAHRYDNKLIEYQNGRMMLMVVGYVASYNDDDVFANDMQSFLEQLSVFDTDIYLHLFVNEFQLQQESERLRVYSDKKFMAERMKMYMEQDEYASTHSSLYRYTFCCKCNSYDWKRMLEHVNNLLESEDAKVFYEVYLADKDEASSVCSRDLGTHLSIEDMLKHKYINEDYDGSKALWYGDNIPKKYRVKEEHDDVGKRRVMYVEEEED